MNEPERAAAIRLHERCVEALGLIAAGLRQFQTLRAELKAHQVDREIARHQAEINRLKKRPTDNRE